MQFSILSKSVFLSKLLSHAKGNGLTWTPPPLSDFGRSRPASWPAVFSFFCTPACFPNVFCRNRPARRLAARPGASGWAPGPGPRGRPARGQTSKRLSRESIGDVIYTSTSSDLKCKLLPCAVGSASSNQQCLDLLCRGLCLARIPTAL